LAGVDNGSLTGFLRQLAPVKRRRRKFALNNTTPTERTDFPAAFSRFLYAASRAASQFDKI